MSLWSRLERRLSDLAGDIILDEYKEQVSQARALLAAGNPIAAIELLTAMLVDKPDHGLALVLLGDAYLQAQDPDHAFDIFARALGQRPGDPEALIGQGQALLELLRVDEAMIPLARAVAEAAGDRTLLAEAYRTLGECWREAGDLDKAVRELRKAVAEAPGDGLAHAALGEAMLVDGGHTPEEVRRHLERAADTTPTPVLALLGLGKLWLLEGHAAKATSSFEAARALIGDAATPRRQNHWLAALTGLGDAALAARDTAAAHRYFLEALELQPSSALLHARLGDAHRAIGNFTVALQSYDRALSLGADVAVLRQALATATLAEDSSRQIQWANDLLVLEPDAPVALVARGLGTLAVGDFVMARALLLAPAEAGNADARAALAQVALAEGDLDGAISHAHAALYVEPLHPRARAQLALARRRRAAIPVDAEQLTPVGAALERLLGSHPELSALVGDVARAVHELDQPLLVTVMGEFSSGKSSFVNAFIGAEVAPTGITPTTATINVVRYGPERGGRIMYREGRSTERVAWDELFPTLRGLSETDARAIEQVEILVPLPQLERIHLVDTPGLNSILPEHEATARAFIQRADAVVWVFTAGQGGKASERAALEAIRAEGRRVLGVLNKSDQLKPAQLAEVVEFVEQTLGDLVEVVVPVSARQASAWKATDALPDGNWPALATALEQRFFAQARQLKRDAAVRRLRAIIDNASSRVSKLRGDADEGARAAGEASSALSLASTEFVAQVVTGERRALANATTTLYRQAAREVLELVRPRRLPFGAHSATTADRDYLTALLDHGFEVVLEAGRGRVAAALEATWRRADIAAREIGRVIGVDVAGDVARVASDRTRLALSEAFDRARAYLRGFLDGGTVDSFFKNDLPRLELAEDAVFHALFRAAPDLDRELGATLARAGAAAIDAVHQRLTHWAGAADVRAFDLEVGTSHLLDDLAGLLS